MSVVPSGQITTAAGSAAAPFVDPVARMSTSLTEIENIYATALNSKENELTSRLSGTYSELHEICAKEGSLPATYEPLAARVFHLYGKVVCEGNRGNSKESLFLFLLSLSIQLGSGKILQAKTLTSLVVKENSLHALPNQLMGADLKDAQAYLEAPAFKELNAQLMVMDVKVISAKIVALGSERALQVAMTLRRILCCYKEIDVFDHVTHCPRFEKIYDLGMEVLTTLNTEDSRWEKVQMINDISCFIYRLKTDPNTLETAEGIKGLLSPLDSALKIVEAEGKSLRAQEWRANINHSKGIALRAVTCSEEKQKIANKKAAYLAMEEALKIADSTEGFNPSLKTMYRNNLAGIAAELLRLAQPVLSANKISALFHKTLEEIANCGCDHNLHAVYHFNAAKFELDQGKRDLCIAHLRKAQDVMKKFPEKSKSIAARLEKFCLNYDIVLESS